MRPCQGGGDRQAHRVCLGGPGIFEFERHIGVGVGVGDDIDREDVLHARASGTRTCVWLAPPVGGGSAVQRSASRQEGRSTAAGHAHVGGAAGTTYPIARLERADKAAAQRACTAVHEHRFRGHC